jgi:DNA-binding NtrC family response regulator
MTVKEAAMSTREIQALIAGDDACMVMLLAQHLVTDLGANVTIVDSIEEGARLAASNGFDVIVATQRLSDGTALELVEAAGNATDAPILIVDEAVDAERVLAAMRGGAADIFTPPVDMGAVMNAVEREVEACRRSRALERRAKRLRRISSKLIRDRRELRQRVDLICRDLVGAYRRLAEKVVSLSGQETAP